MLTASAQKFVIDGIVSNESQNSVEGGPVVLYVELKATRHDTIRTVIKNGKFHLEGRLAYPVPALLKVNGTMRRFVLDKAHYVYEYNIKREIKQGREEYSNYSRFVETGPLDKSLSYIFGVKGKEDTPVTRWYYAGTMDQHQDSVKIIYDKCNAILLHACDTIFNKQGIPFLLTQMKPFTYDKVYPYYQSMPKEVQKSYMCKELYQMLIDEKRGKRKDNTKWKNWEGTHSDGSKMRVEPF